MKTAKPLSDGEIAELQTAVTILIMDAKAGANLPIETNISTKNFDYFSDSRLSESLDPSCTTSSNLLDDARVQDLPYKSDDMFQDVFQGSNSWRVPGMETMDTETYYKAVNSRIQQIKTIRQKNGELIGQQSVDDYFETLNRRRK